MPELDRVCEKRVLLVEDDPAARQSIKLLLLIDRHEVTEAKDGAEGLALFCPGRFDLVIIDYFMPNMQGGQLAAALKDIDLAQPVLLVTAYAEKLVDTQLRVEAVLPKPFGIDELRRAICQVLSAPCV